jgi:Cu-Zn family superoxide dismutase
MQVAAPRVTKAITVVYPTQGNQAHGSVRFLELGDKLHVKVDLIGLSPKKKHGFHIHEFGDCTALDASSAGEHYAPHGEKHALPQKQPRHAGDMGNIQSDAKGEAHLERTFPGLSISSMDSSIIGRAVIVHAEEDKGTQPSGGAGKRIGCGVIGIAQGGGA